LNFEFSETLRREGVIFRGVELPEAVREGYDKSLGEYVSWSMFSSFTEKREEAEEYGRSWRGGVEVLFELRSAWCWRLRNGTYLLHPFAVLRVEAVVGNTVKLVEVELLDPGPVGPIPGQRPAVVARESRTRELHEAAEEGDVRAVARLATRGVFIDARDPDGSTALHRASYNRRFEAVKALA
jgi:hypothetical protein